MLKPAQIRAGRALLDVTQAALATKAGLSLETLKDIEHGTVAPEPAVLLAIESALEALGLEIIPDGLTSGPAGIGVRLKFTAQVVKRIDILENEGGPVGEDDVRP
jgi:transcriptional regulator with XRE-family HTH domain